MLFLTYVLEIQDVIVVLLLILIVGLLAGLAIDIIMRILRLTVNAVLRIVVLARVRGIGIVLHQSVKVTLEHRARSWCC